jgi:hypothetical protein
MVEEVKCITQKFNYFMTAKCFNVKGLGKTQHLFLDPLKVDNDNTNMDSSLFFDQMKQRYYHYYT